MIKKIHCPFHKESTPSCQLYPESNSYYSFCCGRSGNISELKGVDITKLDTTPKYKEDIAETMKYITDLPKKIIRGIEMPYDETYYYFVWPTKDYYLKRTFKQCKDKYKGPSGHARPLYTANEWKDKDKLLFVEGELNAASMAKVCKEYTIVSPGAASNFNAKHLTLCRKFDTIYLIVDRDAAGVMAAINMKELLKPKRVVISLWSQDANEILETNGGRELQKKIKESLEGI